MTDALVVIGPALVIIAVIGTPIALFIISRILQRRERIKDARSLVCLSVSVPRDEIKNPNEASEPVKDIHEIVAPTEQFLASLTTIIHNRNFLDWLFNTSPTVSLEIYSVNNLISFQVVIPVRIRNIVERQIHSYFPDAEVRATVPPRLFPESDLVIAGAILETRRSFVLPIRTYRNLDADPISGITTAMSKLSKDSYAAIQIILKPISDNWRLHAAMASRAASENKSHLVNRSKTARVLHIIWEAIRGENKNETPKAISAESEELIKAIQEKSSKTGFEVMIRVISTGINQQIVKDNLQTIIAGFSQFHHPQLNGFKYRMKFNKSFARDFLYRQMGRGKRILLNVEEIASLFHFPNRYLETPGIKWLTARTLPAPPDLPSVGVVIGKSVFRGMEKLVRLQEEDRRRHLFMIGKTGTGKTTLFETMIEQDMVNGKGLCFVDPLGDAVENLLKKVPTNRAKDVIIFDPSDTKHPLGLNLLEWHNPEERDFLIQEVIEIFYKLFDPNRTGIVGPQWEHWARNAALTVMNLPQGGSLIDLPRLFTDDEFREYAIGFVTDPVVKAFWEQQLAKTADFHKSEMYNYFISKFGRFMTNDLMRNIIGQTKSSFQFRKIMDEGKILFVNLAKGKIGEINSNLLGLILVSKIQVSAFSRADVPEDERRDFYLYVDEFQNFTTDTFATILSEARKYRLCLNIANQYLAQLTEHIRDAVIGNVGTIISYRIGAEDAEFLAHEMPGVTIEDFTNLDRFQAYIKLLINLTPSRPFSMNGIKTDSKGSPEMSKWLKDWTRHHFAMPPVELIVPRKSAVREED